MRRRKAGKACVQDDECVSERCVEGQCVSELLLDSGDEDGTRTIREFATDRAAPGETSIKRTKKHQRGNKGQGAEQPKIETGARPAFKAVGNSFLRDATNKTQQKAASEESWVMPPYIFFPILVLLVIIGLFLLWWGTRLLMRLFRHRKAIAGNARGSTAAVVHPVLTIDAHPEEGAKRTVFERIPAAEMYAPAPKKSWPGLMPSIEPAPINLAATPEPLLDHIPKTPLEQREFASPVNIGAPVHVVPSRVAYPSSDEMDTQRAWQ